MRRALLRLPNKSYNRFLADLLMALRNTRRDEAAAFVRATLSGQDSASAYLLPQKWESHWPIGPDPLARERRSQSVHLLGNLTLLTGRLNGKVSHGAWLGRSGKWAALERHDTLLLNRHVRQLGSGGWDERRIHERTDTLIDVILQIWPVPDGHSGRVAFAAAKREVSVGVLDLISEGLLTVGQQLLPRTGGAADKAIVLADGSLQVGDRIYDTPSGSGKAVLGSKVNGWSFWQVNVTENISLGDLRAEYAATFDVDTTAEDAQDMVAT